MKPDRSYTYVEHTNPENYDSDDIIYANGGRGYRSRKDGKIKLIRCPACKRENWAMAVTSGECAWCGYKEEE